MKQKTKVLILTLVVTVLAFAASAPGPLGGFWGLDLSTGRAPTASQLPLFMILAVLDALMLGLGLSFLAFGFPLLSETANVSRGLARAAHLAISWLFVQWWPHSNLHIVTEDLGGILVIDYVFHTTIMLASIIIVYFLIAARRDRKAAA